MGWEYRYNGTTLLPIIISMTVNISEIEAVNYDKTVLDRRKIGEVVTLA